MNIVVQKYGGSSVENKDKLKKICNKIISYIDKGINLVVVVSAQGKTTDKLINKACEYATTPTKKELDLLLTTGEIQTVALLSMMLNNKGYDSIGLTGQQAGIISDSTYGNATIKSIYISNILNYLNEGKIVVIAGFQAADKFGNLTTLGRGGSDLTAVAIASAIKAKKCEIYSDIDGIFSADPKVISKAKLLKKISYNEMLEAATSGAKVLHNRSVNMGKTHNIPILVKNSQTKNKGSVVESSMSRGALNIDDNVSLECYKVKFISKLENVTKISVIGDMIMSNKEAVHTIFDLAYINNITIYMISFSELAINIIVDSTKADNFMKKLHSELIEKA
ncbi:MAG: aspartate kinase [Clostridia bacterium]